jgi:hypothetical protein
VIEVTLSYADLLIAGNAGVLRQVNALRKRLHDPDAHHRDPMEAHVAGAIAEWAVAQYLNVAWRPHVGISWAGQVDGDVQGIEVRSTAWKTGCLVMHDYSFDDRAYLLVLTHRSPTFELAGWILGREAKDARYWKSDAKRPSYFVPQSALRPVGDLFAKEFAC